MVTIVTSAKCTRTSVARAVITRFTSTSCGSGYTQRFVSKLMKKVALSASQVSGGMNISPVEAGGINIFASWSGRHEHFARLRRRGAIGCMLLYTQACNATFSGRLDTKYFFSCRYELSKFIMLVKRDKTTCEVRNNESKNSL